MNFIIGSRSRKQVIRALVLFAALVLCLASAACSEAGSGTTQQNSSGQPKSMSTLSQQAAQQDFQPEVLFKGPKSVEITNVADNSLVSTSPLDISGMADPGTVISINDEISAVGKDRMFTVSVKLDEGLNVLEINASDPQGDQETAYLTVTYEPQQ